MMADATASADFDGCEEEPRSDTAPLATFLAGHNRDERKAALRAMQDGLNATPRAQLRKPASPFAPVPLRALPTLEVRPDDRLWGDVVTRGTVAVLAGQPGIGKSTLLRYLVQAIAAGTTYLGKRTSPGGCSVLVLDYETPDAFRRAFWREVYGDEIASIESIHIATELPSISRVGAEAVIAAAKASSARLVVIDTLSAAFEIENENDNAEMEDVVRTLRTIAKAGLAVLVLAHPSKQGEDLRGASALKGGIDTLLTFKVDGNVPADGPDETTRFALKVTKNRTGDLGTTILQWDGAGGFIAPDAATDGELCRSEEIIAEIVASARPGTIRARDIAERAKGQNVSPRTARWALKSLAYKGRVRSVSHGHYGVVG
jgi:hypothetical protein